MFLPGVGITFFLFFDGHHQIFCNHRTRLSQILARAGGDGMSKGRVSFASSPAPLVSAVEVVAFGRRVRRAVLQAPRAPVLRSSWVVRFFSLEFPRSGGENLVSATASKLKFPQT